MALLDVHFFSQALGMATSMNLLLPEKRLAIAEEREMNLDPKFVNPARGRVDCWDGETPLQVLYLLHGASDDQAIQMALRWMAIR